jgi:hypothetical protein
MVPGGSGGAVAINNTTATPHSWMTPDGIYIVEGTSSTTTSTAATYGNVVMGGN